MPYTPGFFRPGVNPGYSNTSDPQAYLRNTLGSLAPLPALQQAPQGPVYSGGGATPPGGAGSMWGYLPGQNGTVNTGNIGTITGPTQPPTGSGGNGGGSGLPQSYQDAISGFGSLGGLLSIFGQGTPSGGSTGAPTGSSNQYLDAANSVFGNQNPYASHLNWETAANAGSPQDFISSLFGNGWSDQASSINQMMNAAQGNYDPSGFRLDNPLYSNLQGVNYHDTSTQQPQTPDSSQSSWWDSLLGTVGNKVQSMFSPTNLINTGANLLVPGLGTGLGIGEKLLVQNAVGNGNYDPAEHSALTNYLVSQSNTPLSSWNDQALTNYLDNRTEQSMGNAGIDPGQYDWSGIEFPWGSGGIGGGEGDIGCPTLDMIMEDGRTAEHANEGDSITLYNPETGEEMDGEIVRAVTKMQPCVKLTAENGATFKCSISAPMATTIGEVKAPGLKDLSAIVKVSAIGCVKVKSVQHIGDQLVRHITVKVKDGETKHEDRYFWVGSGDGTLWAHHNIKVAPTADYNGNGQDDYSEIYGDE